MTAISEWSFHRMLFAGDLDHLDFPAYARDLGFDSLEFSNHFFRRTDAAYLRELVRRCEGMERRLLMVDGCGFLGAPMPPRAFLPWLEVAAEIGCEAIRVMVRSPRGEDLTHATWNLCALMQCARKLGLVLVVENHGGKSSDPEWLTCLCEEVGGLRVLSDFGNWNGHDPYKATYTMLPHTWGCSGKMNDNPVDFARMQRLGAPKPSVEWEGSTLSESEGAVFTRCLIESLWPITSPQEQPRPLSVSADKG